MNDEQERYFTSDVLKIIGILIIMLFVYFLILSINIIATYIVTSQHL